MIGNFHDQFLGEFGRGDAPILTRLALWYKRLEKGKFTVPSTAAANLEIDAAQFSMLLNGFDLAKVERQKRYSRIWAYLGDANNNLIAYDFTDSRKRDGPASFLEDFKGYLQADAYAGYDGIYAGKEVYEVACWAHARRKFFEALGSNKAAASWALRCIQVLYRIEKRLAKSSKEEREKIRQNRSRRVLNIFKAWLDRQVLIESKGPLAKAIRYSLNQWDALSTFTKDGELTIDNNKAERAMRTIAVGRKNWLFAGSQDGGKRAAILCSLIASCKQHGIDPLAYLTDVLNKLSSGQVLNIDSLTPDKWLAPG